MSGSILLSWVIFVKLVIVMANRRGEIVEALVRRIPQFLHGENAMKEYERTTRSVSPENFGNAQPFAARAASSVLTELTARPSVSMSEALISVPRTIMDLTLEEKIKLLAGKDTWTTHAIDRLKIPSITVWRHQEYVGIADLFRPPMVHMAFEERLSSMEYVRFCLKIPSFLTIQASGVSATFSHGYGRYL